MQNKAEELVYYTAQWVTGTSLSWSGTALSEAPGSDLIDRHEELCVLPRIEVASREKSGLTACSHTKTDYLQRLGPAVDGQSCGCIKNPRTMLVAGREAKQTPNLRNVVLILDAD